MFINQCEKQDDNGAQLTPALARRSSDGGSIPFWLMTTKLLSLPEQTCMQP